MDNLTKDKVKKYIGIFGLIILTIASILIGDLPKSDTKFILSTFFCAGFIYCLMLANQEVAKKYHVQKEHILGVLGLTLLLYWCGSNITSRECFVLIGLFAFFALYYTHLSNAELNIKYNDIKNINTYLSSQEDEFSYKLNVELVPNWDVILKQIFKDEQLIKKLMKKENSKALEAKDIDKRDGLFESDYLSSFRFITFYSSRIGIPMTWSNYYNVSYG
ncbi:MAG: hypothetical protein K0R73_428 [Candidatus Midichloriaceae bacterium]|jgi:hypothetical protein|nr:hypothetical protein [Candidatus Midichloriaceae bacterium]